MEADMFSIARQYDSMIDDFQHKKAKTFLSYF